MNVSTDAPENDTDTLLLEEEYRHLKTSFDAYQTTDSSALDALAIFQKGLEAARDNENKEYSRRHMRIYGMLRQAMDYVFEHKPERIGEIQRIIKETCRDIGLEEWSVMIKRFNQV